MTDNEITVVTRPLATNSRTNMRPQEARRESDRPMQRIASSCFAGVRPPAQTISDQTSQPTTRIHETKCAAPWAHGAQHLQGRSVTALQPVEVVLLFCDLRIRKAGGADERFMSDALSGCVAM